MTRCETLRPAAPAVSPAASPAAPRAAPSGVVEAQLLGQPGARRGLREGPAALDRARRAYLRTEWTGEGDRRPAPGLLTCTVL